VLAIGFVGARMATGDPTGVAPLVDSVERWLDAGAGAPDRADAAPKPIVFDHDEFARLPAQVAVYRAGLALLAGDTAGTIAHAARVLELAEPSDHLRRGAAAALLGLAHWSLGDLDEARSRYSDAVESFVRAGFIPDLLGCSLALADIQIAQGRLGDARRTYESALRHATGYAVLRGTADMHVGLSQLRLEWNELDDADRHLQTSIELGEHAGLPQHPYRWRVATARLRGARGDLDGALELLDDAEGRYNTDFSPAIQPVAAVKARVQIARGDVASALRLAADRDLTANDDLTYVREYEHLTLARTLLAQSAGRPGRTTDDAIRLVKRLLDAAEEGHREGSVIEALVLLALAYEARGDRSAAARALGQALVRAEPEGYVRTFVDAGAALIPLLRSVPPTAGAGRHARRVLVAADASGPSGTPAHDGLVDPLSARELEVLHLLRSDLSGPELARELHVSLNTIRTHTKNIYTKLGVTNRREAVRRAAGLGL
jgi:LuxR family maltose regulon positive regulatory protein